MSLKMPSLSILDRKVEYPSPVLSLHERTTSPTRGEVSLLFLRIFLLRKSKEKSYAVRIPLPLWERSSEGRVRGVKQYRHHTHSNLSESL